MKRPGFPELLLRRIFPGERLIVASWRGPTIWSRADEARRSLAWIEAALGWTVEIVRKPSRWVWCPADVEPPPMPAFTVLKRRWVVERTFAWLNRNRRLAKDFEATIQSAVTWLYIASVKLMTRRLATN